MFRLGRYIRPLMTNGARSFSGTAVKSDIARFTAVGRIGTDLERQTAQSGSSYLRYALAVNNAKGQVSWFNIVVFDDRAIEFMTKYLRKGSPVFVEADASIHQFASESGENRSSLQLVQQTVSPVGFGKKKDVVDGEATEVEDGH
jgi:single-stranded DNA-binding protein